MADRITPNSGPDGDGQGCASTKRAYIKPELILLYGNEGAGQAANYAGTASNKSNRAGEDTAVTVTASNTIHHGPS